MAEPVAPAGAISRATVYERHCKSGAPKIVNQVFKPAAQEFI